MGANWVYPTLLLMQGKGEFFFMCSKEDEENPQKEQGEGLGPSVHFWSSTVHAYLAI